MAEKLRRHDLVWIEPSVWAAAIAGADEPLLRDWARRDWPLVVRRPTCADEPGLVPVGLPLPPDAGKKRLAFSFAAGAIGRVAPPPFLADAAWSAPASWRTCSDRLLRADAQVRVYGSLAWQHLTGLPYLAAGSDLDLLWRWRDAATTQALLAELRAIERVAPMRIDGELIAADDTAVHWRELLSGADDVLGKRSDRIVSVRRDAFLAGCIDA
ncbi:MAG: mdcG [Rhodospirillales bacterium]|nr:mdcG [Rhodospirillales bacterium]